jgi:hypothetical protein
MGEPLMDVRGLALVPGPAEIEQPLYSFEVQDELVSHSPEAVAAVFLNVPGMKRSNDAAPDSGLWKARWEEGDRCIDLDFTVMEIKPGEVVWGGSNLQGRCRFSDLLYIWSALRERFEGIWLHDADCRLYTPEGFNQQ